ncbi:MAG: alcohol dehydrogenase catalytic domain-containing protein, partial [Rhodobacteraceae bacterium]|nr:alcohol dehydrogenase catalytic domain-containing protein [Paracoccaceae bacterium]
MLENFQQKVVFTERGAKANLATAEVPAVGQGDVLVRVAACALNFADLLALQDRYQEKTVWPHTPGMEISGIVEAVGQGVDQNWMGQPMAAFVGRGGLAEYLIVPAHRAIRLPATVDLETAAALPIAYGTSHLALTRNANLQNGQTLVVLGASGGVGLTAVEIGKRMGATVIACARGQDKCDIARSAGADVTLDTGTVDLKSE